MRTPSLVKLFILLGLAGCTRARLISSNPGNLAPPEIGRSFALTPTAASADLHVDQTRVSIAKGALEKEFLLHSSLVMQQTAPNFHGLRSRVVFFRRVDQKVVMIEASDGLLLTKDYPQTLPLAEYAILAETDDLITIDFNAGMSRLLLGTDFETRESNEAGASYVSVKSSFSYLSGAAMVDDRMLEVHQTSLVELPVNAVAVHLPIEVIYFLSPYRPNPGFKPTVAPLNFDHLGFVEAPTKFNAESGQITYAAKRDLRKPIIYTISANTPPRFRAAIREGALYWNKAFGRAVIEVKEASSDRAVPDPLNNVIRWVDYDSAGFAYADLQLDPRTGEILHQQVYLTSAWARLARADLRRHPLPTGGASLLRRLGAATHCRLEMDQTLAQDLGEALSRITEPERIEKVINDTLRAVVAHEVGHTLGLLHNFAGSLAANYALDQREDLARQYLTTGRAPETVVASSSIMDYTRWIETLILGDQIQHAPKAAEYDEKAIQALYLDRTFKPGEMPLFCTDAQVDDYADCQRHDAGHSLVEWIRHDGRQMIATLPGLLIEGFIEAKVPSFGEPSGGVTAYQPNLKRLAAAMFKSHLGLVKLLRGETRLLSVERQFVNHGPAYSTEIKARTAETLAGDLARAGGLDQVLLKSTPKLTAALSAEFERRLHRPEILRGRTLDDKHYEFTTEDLGQIKDIAAHVTKALPLEMARVEINALSGKNTLNDEDESAEEFLRNLLKGPPKRFEITPVTRDFATYLVRRAAFFLFATRGEPLEFKRQFAWSSTNTSVEGALGDETNLKLPRFAYPFDLRLKTAELLRPDRGQSPAWGHTERRVLGALYAKMYGEAAPGVDVTAPDALDGWPPEAQRWMLEARELGTLLELSSQRPPRADLGKGAAAP